MTAATNRERGYDGTAPQTAEALSEELRAWGTELEELGQALATGPADVFFEGSHEPGDRSMGRPVSVRATAELLNFPALRELHRRWTAASRVNQQEGPQS